MAAVQEFQANPQKAAEKYANNKELIGFFAEFSAIMGDHFLSLDKKKKAEATAASNSAPLSQKEQDLVRKVNENPECMSAQSFSLIFKLLMLCTIQ